MKLNDSYRNHQFLHNLNLQQLFDVDISLAETLNAIEKHICSRWIKLNMDEVQIRESKKHFFENFKIPGVVGCIDGTHIRIMKPHDDFALFYNSKAFYSLIAMIICDYNMVIRAVDARCPWSSHDSLIWSVSKAHTYFEQRYENGDQSSWLLRDGGYALEPFVLTPYRDPESNSPQHRFNLRHASARNIVERTIGVLKGRYRCLSRQLNYQPPKVVTIINVCCALHNICRYYKVRCTLGDEIGDAENDDDTEYLIYGNNVAQTIRDTIANSL